MKGLTIRRAVSLSFAGAVVAFGTHAFAQDTTVVPPPPQTTILQPPPPPPTSTNDVTVTQPTPIAQPAPAATTTTTSAPVFTGSQVKEETTSGYAPNPYLLTSGLLVFGVPYIASVIVASSSDHYGDSHLYVPIAGPWMDLADRGPTNGNDTEATNKVLLGINGVFQALGALEMVGAFVFPETRMVTTVPATALTPEMVVSPAKMGEGGYGVAAVARF